MFYDESLHHLLCCSKIPIEKIFVSEIWTKIFSAYQITGFCNQHQWNSLIFCMSIQIHTNLKTFVVSVVRNGCGQSGHAILKLAVSKEWIDGMNWFFTCWWKFRKAKNYFNDFWVCLVKNRRGHLVHETLKSAERN